MFHGEVISVGLVTCGAGTRNLVSGSGPKGCELKFFGEKRGKAVTTIEND